jgi:multidrug resistance protein, MATE family
MSILREDKFLCLVMQRTTDNNNFFYCLREILIMAGPLMGSRISGTVTSFISMVMISRLGHASLAASALINSVLYAVVIPLWTLFVSVGILVGHNYGAQKPVEAGKVLRQGLVLSVIIGVAGMLLLYNVAPILVFFGQDQKLALVAQQYFHAYSWGLIPHFWYCCLIQFLVGISKQKINLLFAFLNMPCVLLTGYILTFGKFGFAAYGITGMGYSMPVGAIIVNAIIIIYLCCNKQLHQYQLWHWDLKRNLHYLKEIVTIGWPIAMMMATELVIFSISVFLIGWLGETSLAAQQVSGQINLIAYLFPMSISQACTILISQNLGRHNYHLARKLGYAAFLLSAVITTLIAVSYFISPTTFVGLYINVHSKTNPATVSLAITLLLATGIMNIFDGIRCTAAAALRGLRDTLVPMLIFTALGAVISLPTGYLLATTMHLGAIGYIDGFIIGFVIGAAILIYRFHKLSAIERISLRPSP